MKETERLRVRKDAYTAIFASPSGKVIAEDLRQFCRADASCFHADPRMHAVLEGRREVWLRIQQHTNLSIDELWDALGGKNAQGDPISFQLAELREV